MTQITNIDIAVLQRVNELAGRHGLSPADFVAVFRPAAAPGRSALEVETFDASRAAAYHRMATALGLGADDGRLEGTEAEILAALDRAITAAPRPRRGR